MRRLIVALSAFASIVLSVLPSLAQPIEIAAGFRPAHATLVSLANGSTLLALQSDEIAGNGQKPSVMEIYRFNGDGSLQSASPFLGGPLAGARLALLPGGDVALFLPSHAGLASRSVMAQLLRLSPEGVVRHRAAIGHPNYAKAADRTAPDAGLYANVMVAGPKGTLLVGGGYGGGPYIPWWGHLTADGTKLAEGDDLKITPGFGVTAATFDTDGGFRLAGSHFSEPGKFDAVVGLYDAAGKLKARHVLLAKGGEVGVTCFTAAGLVFIGDNRQEATRVRLFDRDGKPLGEAAWEDKDHLPTGLLADGEGLAGILDDRVIRIDGSGRIAWRSPPGEYLALARAPDGSLRALLARHDDKGRYTIELAKF